MYNMLHVVFTKVQEEREGPQDQSSTDTLSGTCTLIEI